MIHPPTKNSQLLEVYHGIEMSVRASIWIKFA